MGRCLVLCALIAAPACYRPSIEAPCTASCETPFGAGACPGEQICGADLRCRSADDVDCSKQHGVDAAGEVCVGHKFLTVCFVPTDDVTLQNATINTDSDPRCTLVPGPAEYPQVCAIVGRSVTVIGNVVITGTRAFAIAATDTVAVMGTLDGASHTSLTAGPAANMPSPKCSALIPAMTGAGAGCGGAGGSFQAPGGVGGKGTSTGGGNAGIPSDPITKDLIVGLSGPCASGDGSNGDNANAGAGGAGGGAIALLGGTVSIAGLVNVSGAGGSGGRLDEGGGGGGGAGGMVLIDGDAISVSGIVLANGGGGGGGAAFGTGSEGGVGFEPTATSPFNGVAGGAGGGSAGHGGAGGGSDTSNGSIGLPGSAAAGGGGGGGVGYILVTAVIPGMMSPAPTAL